MPKSLRKLVRYSRRAGHILLNQGPGFLLQVVERHFKEIPSPVRPPARLLALSEPFEPLCFPECPTPIASVVIPIQEEFRVVHHCLAALLAQRCSHPFQVIVVETRPTEDRAVPQRLWKNVQYVTSRELLGLGGSRNRGAEAASGEYLVFLCEHTQVQAGWLDALIDTFGLRKDAGVVGSRLLSPSGRQQEAGGIVLRDGRVCPYGFLDDPSRPEYSYLRAVEVCSWESMAVRRSLFLELSGLDDAFASSRYAAVDFAYRIRRAGFAVYYQPTSETVMVETAAADSNKPGCGGSGTDAPDRALFLNRWQSTLLGHGSRADSLELEYERAVFKRAFISDWALPAPDLDSGSLRMFNLMSILQAEGFKITFASIGLEARQPYLSDLQKRGIECLYRPYEDSIEEHLRLRGKDYDLVILSRDETAAELIRPVRRWCPHAKILFDTVDLHFQRAAREASIRGDPKMERIAQRVKRQELSLVAQADATLVVSEEERTLLAEEIPGAEVRVVSNIHRIPGSAKSFEERADLMFVGGFAHPPNRDAVLYFCREVLPRILTSLPEARLFVIGSDPPPEIRCLESDQVHILGYVPDIEPFLNNCRVSVAPLRFGAGVKGKINQSLAYGLPVVGTTIAVEGMFLKNGESVLIADDARSFADAVVKLFRDAALWNKLSTGGLAVMEEHFSFAAAQRAVVQLLAS